MAASTKLPSGLRGRIYSSLSFRSAIVSFTVFALVPFVSPLSHASTKHKVTHHHRRRKISRKSKRVHGIRLPDAQARILVRRHAPLFIDEKHRDDVIQINRDGTFSRGGSTQSQEGHWKVSQGKLLLKWRTGEQYGYPLTFHKNSPLLVGQSATRSGHFVLHSAD